MRYPPLQLSGLREFRPIGPNLDKLLNFVRDLTAAGAGTIPCAHPCAHPCAQQPEKTKGLWLPCYQTPRSTASGASPRRSTAPPLVLARLAVRSASRSA